MTTTTADIRDGNNPVISLIDQKDGDTAALIDCLKDWSLDDGSSEIDLTHSGVGDYTVSRPGRMTGKATATFLFSGWDNNAALKTAIDNSQGSGATATACWFYVNDEDEDEWVAWNCYITCGVTVTDGQAVPVKLTFRRVSDAVPVSS